MLRSVTPADFDLPRKGDIFALEALAHQRVIARAAQRVHPSSDLENNRADPARPRPCSRATSAGSPGCQTADLESVRSRGCDSSQRAHERAVLLHRNVCFSDIQLLQVFVFDEVFTSTSAASSITSAVAERSLRRSHPASAKRSTRIRPARQARAGGVCLCARVQLTRWYKAECIILSFAPECLAFHQFISHWSNLQVSGHKKLRAAFGNVSVLRVSELGQVYIDAREKPVRRITFAAR